LKDDIDDESNAVDDEIKDPQNSWIAVTKRSILVECSNGDSTNDEEDNEGTDTNGLEVKWGEVRWWEGGCWGRNENLVISMR
jgi:hypothetical protein